MVLRGTNPALRRLQNYGEEGVTTAASYKGVALKSIYFVGLTLAAALASAYLMLNYTEAALYTVIISGAVALVAGLVAVFAPGAVKIAGSIYAAAEGVLVGAVSMLVGQEYGGVVLGALLATVLTFAVMATLYFTGLIKVSYRFKAFMISALTGIILINFVMLILGFVVPGMWDMFYGNGILSIAISALMVVFAAFFILVDLSNIDGIVRGGLDKKYEWVAAFGLVVTIIWLYMEFLRLFSKIASRRR